MVSQQPLTRRTIEAYEAYQDLFLRQWNVRKYDIPFHLENFVGNLPKSALLLDLGCGPGQDTRYLRREGYRTYGVDLTWSFLLAAKVRAPRLPVVQSDMTRLPFSHQIFDGIWAAASIIHISKVQARTLFSELFTLTKPGGWMAITVMYGREAGVPERQWIPGRYLAKWGKRELKHSVQGAKWEVTSVEKVKNQERKGMWLNLLARRPC